MTDSGNAPPLSPLKRAYLAIEDLERKLAAASGKQSAPIAIVGIGCRFPGGVDGPDAFAALLQSGTDAISPAPPDGRASYRAFRTDVPAPLQTMPPAGFIAADVAEFDPQFFGIAPREAVGMDPQQRLLLEVAWEALEDAGESPALLRDTATGVFVGICSGDYAQLQFAARDPDLLNAHFTSGIGHSVASGRLSYLWGLRGPSLSIDTACSSSLVATQLACRSLRVGECTTAIVGGVNLILDSDLTLAFMRSGMLSPDGRCKTFADGANGFARGEGCGVVVLKPLADALAAGNRVYAVIRGIAVNQDGASSALSAPSGPAQEDVIRAALRDAQLGPADIDVLEAHGTGTELGDPIEVRALQGAYGGRGRQAPLCVSSVKTNLGHLEGAAGVAGLIRLALSLDREFIPAHLHWHTPSRHIPWQELDIEVPTRGRPWARAARPRRAAVSSFGFSGTNCHAVLEEAPIRLAAADASTALPRLVTLSAATPKALDAMLVRYAAHFAPLTGAAFADACHTSSAGRAHLQHRLSVLARNGAEVAERLSEFAREGVAAGVVAGRRPVEVPRLAFAFTGQGSQYAGMGRELFASWPAFRRTVEAAVEVFRGATGADVHAVLCGEDAAWLDDTGIAQPALFVFEVALANVLLDLGLRPAVLFGHSIGEYAAACLAGVFSLEDGIRLLARRGELMQSRTPPGAMIAVAGSEADVSPKLAAYADAAIAAVNGPRAVVIAGTPASVAALDAEFRRSGLKTKLLEVPRAFHSPLMEPILDEFERAFDTVRLQPPRIRLLSSVTGAPLDAAEATSALYWRRHARAPVRFGAAAAAFATKPGVAVEVGPRAVLSAFERDAEAAATAWVPTQRRGAMEPVLEAVQALYAAGFDIDWRALTAGERRARVRLPTYAFQRERHWLALRPVSAVAAADPALHPLLGRRVGAAGRERLFEVEVRAANWSFLADHRVAGGVIMPGAAFIEALRAAGEAVVQGPVTLEGVELHEALVVDGDAPRVMQLVVDGEGETPVARLYSRAAVVDAEWTLHASARCGSAATAVPARVALDDVRRRCAQRVDRETFYKELADRQLTFGPALQGLTLGWAGRGEALAQIDLPSELADEAERYRVHPALLDACLQAVALGLRGDPALGRDALFLPVSAARCEWHAPVPRRCIVHVRAALEDAGRVLGADVTVCDESGAVVLELRGLRFHSAAAAFLGSLTARRLEKLMYEVEWRTVGLDAAVSARSVVAEWVAALPAALERQAHAHRIDDYEKFFARFENVSAAAFAVTLNQLGWTSAHAALPAAERAAAVGVVPRHRRLFARMLEVVGDPRPFRSAGDGVAAASVDAELAELLLQYPQAAAEITLVRRCAPALAAALQGRIDPLELLFPAGSIDDAETLYRDSPLAVTFNSAVADCIERLVAALDRPLRVLEIGGGTGGTTSHVLQRVGGRVDYTFTDISPLFTARARKRFGSHDGVTCRELDIERDPASQGFAGQKYDVVIASNVLHATADLRATADRVRSLLAPGGTLLALEVFAPHNWFDLTVGLTPGWWLFTDLDLRPSYPTVSAATWRALLSERGFSTPHAVPGAAAGDGVLARQGIVVATAPAAASAESGAWLVIGDTAVAVAAALDANGVRCTVMTGAELAALRRAGGLRAALGERFGSGGCRHVVYLAASLDARRLAAVDFQADDVCATALEVAIAAASVDPAQAPTVWFVTCGAQAVTGDEATLEPSQATLWGLGRTLDLEHPALGVYRVDLDPSNPYEQTEALARLLQNGVPERQIALRDGRAYVARVRHWAAASRAAVTNGAYEVVFGERGSVDSLAVRPAERVLPAANEVEICVAATALNFKDVLNVLGLYPGDPGPLGSECAGVVVRVGREVVGFAPGDRVMAFIGGAFKRYVCAPAWQVAAIPDGLGFAAAATVPVAFLTAAYALWRCARLTAGDRVLIHAATGGVGMAALQLARAAGAEVYATAGTPAKRRLLAALGVAHIYDSRSLEFRDAILRDTAGRGVDVVLNSLADEFVAASFAVTARGGRFLEIGKRGIWSPEQVRGLGRDIEYHVIDWGITAKQDASSIRTLLEELARRLQRGEIEPLPVRSMPLRRLADAFRYMAQGRHIGKIVITHEQPEDAPLRREVVRADGTYVVAGGLSGIGLLTAEWLAARGARHLALFGRRPPDADVLRRLAVLRAAGVSVETASVDVVDRAAVAAFLAAVRAAYPPIRGVFQSTGVLDDGVLLHQTWQRFATVFAPKIRGTANLHELTRADPLDCFVLYSSLAGMLGSAGQANHAAANAFLDTLAAARRIEGLPALSVNWGPWAEAGAAVRYGVVARGGTKGLAAIATGDAFDVLTLALTRGLVNVAAADVNWAAFLAADGASSPFLELLHSTTARADVKVSGSERTHGWLTELEALPAARRRMEILRFVRAQMVRLLGLNSGAVEIDRPLSELGLDSLLAVETRNVLGRAFAVTLPATVTFDHPSIEALADYLYACKFEAPSAATASVEPPPRDALASIEELADDDLDRLIEEKLRAHD